ncbi:MAG: M81 family metallopeptidase [Hyphomicrobiaceae bacterium]
MAGPRLDVSLAWLVCSWHHLHSSEFGQGMGVMARKVLIGGFKHETNTFSRLLTGLDAYRSRSLHIGDAIAAAYRGTKTEIAAFLDACQRYGWQPVLSIVGDATPSGLVTKEAFDTFAGHMLDTLDKHGPVDAVLLQLHGAMVCEHTPDGEGSLLRAIRQKVGWSVPIGVTLDLHANVTHAMAHHADAIVSYRTYPHVDTYEIAVECADLIARTLAGEIHPTVTLAQGTMIDGLDHGRTTTPGPMTEALAMAGGMMKEPGVHSVSVLAGFAKADIPDVGPSALVVGEGHDPRYRDMATSIMTYAWETRHRSSLKPLMAAEAVGIAKEKGKLGAPVVIADYADNPGGGGYSDSMGLVTAMIDAGLENAAVSAICDPEAAAACHKAGLGAKLRLAVGGKIDPLFGPTIEAEGTVMALTDGRFRIEGPMQNGVAVDMGPSAVFKIGGVEIVLASKRYQNYCLTFFSSLGIDPKQRSVLAVKSMQHFRAAYQPIAGEVLIVDEGNGITSNDISKLPFKHVRRPIFPLDLS